MLDESFRASNFPAELKKCMKCFLVRISIAMAVIQFVYSRVPVTNINNTSKCFCFFLNFQLHRISSQTGTGVKCLNHDQFLCSFCF